MRYKSFPVPVPKRDDETQTAYTIRLLSHAALQTAYDAVRDSYPDADVDDEIEVERGWVYISAINSIVALVEKLNKPE
jgi:hypothetical protein